MDLLPPELIDQVLSLCTLHSVEQFKSRKLAKIVPATWKRCARRHCDYTHHATVYRIEGLEGFYAHDMLDETYHRVRYLSYCDSPKWPLTARKHVTTTNIDELRDLPIANEGIRLRIKSLETNTDCFAFLTAFITRIVLCNTEIDSVSFYKRFCKSENLRSLTTLRCSGKLPAVESIVEMISECPRLKCFSISELYNPDTHSWYKYKNAEFELICKTISRCSKRAVTFSVQFNRKFVKEFLAQHGLGALDQYYNHVTVRPNSCN